MKFSYKAILSVLAIAPVVFSASAGFAQQTRVVTQPTGTRAHYLGAGVALDTNNNNAQSDASVAGNVQGRYALQNAPVSVRGAALINDQGSVVMPMVSYDVPITNNANVYVGGGYAFHVGNETTSLLGDRNAPVVAIGAEAELNRNLVLYGDTKLGINAFENNSNPAVTFQVGAAYRFNRR